MNKLRNILIILFYLTGIPFLRRIMLNKPLLRIWCLHDIKESEVGKFEEKVKYLKSKYNIISIDDFKSNNLDKKKLNILFTFDDGYCNWLEYILPVLDKYSIKALFFINDDFKEYSSLLTEKGHTLGGHSMSHKYLTKINDEELNQEVAGSVPSDYFAYPFGDKKSYNKEVINKVSENYKYAFSIIPGFNNKKSNSYKLHRDSLDVDTPNWIFNLWFKGCYDFKKWI
ncbi:polysaccharide deacetylase family protein [bacterium]|nr:polysaccharide deacetylase family protein [bacterium]